MLAPSTRTGRLSNNCGRASFGSLALITLVISGVGALAWVSCSKEEPGGQAPVSKTDTNNPSEAAPASKPAPIDPATTGEIKGIVKFTGTAPPREKINITSECSKPGHTSVEKEELIVNSNGTLKNVFVSITQGLEGRSFEAPTDSVVLDQVGCVYTPHVVAVQTGQPLIIKNSDGTTHNVNGSAGKNTGFNNAMLPGSEPLKARFKSAETRKLVKCDIHPWMNAWIHITNHPYFAITGDSGEFTIKNLPPGKYTMEAIHESLGVKKLNIEIAPKDTKTADFTFEGKK